jgi:nucleoside-diphosphate-sugar epimerase
VKILITGAAGFQAKYVINRLQPKHELTLFDIVPMQTTARFIKGDITKHEDVLQACAGQDAVIHLVALVRGRQDKPLDAFVDIMVKGIWNVADACVQTGVKRLVNISSIAATGWPKDHNHCYRAADHCGFVANDIRYSLSKNLSEGIMRAYHEARGLAVVNLRPGVIAGDGVNGEPTRYVKGNEKFWFVYVHPEDVAQAVERAVETDAVKYGSYYVVAGRQDSWFDWTEAAKDIGYQPQHNWENI